MRRVDGAANISFRRKRLKASKALIDKSVALLPTSADGVFRLVFRHVTWTSIDFHKLG
ncbi:MAG: hypothetical protein U1E23_01060 [Reyranellaceae bacterium]